MTSSREYHHLALGIILCLWLISFIGFDRSPIQPWDEALYAIRARAILHVPDAFFDQTSFAVGGLYSSSKPPLAPWGIAVFMHIFGENTFGVRFFSILCHGFVLLLVYFLALRIVSPQTAIFAPLLLGITTLWNTYARQAMSDIPALALVLLALLALLKAIEKRNFSWYILFSVATSLALLTRYAFSFLPFALGILCVLHLPKSDRKQHVLAFMSASGVALSIGSLWYLYMYNLYGWDFLSRLLLPHLVTAVENNARPWWYYGNQILVANPLLVGAFPALILLILTWKKRSPLLQISIVWSGLAFLLLSFARTKMPYYTLWIFPPLLFLTLYLWEISRKGKLHPTLQWLLLWSVLFATLWSLFPSLRNALQTMEFSPFPLLFLICIVWMIFCAFVLPDDVLRTVAKFLQKPVLLFLSSVLLLRIGVNNAVEQWRTDNGAQIVAQLIRFIPPQKLCYLYHKQNEADRWNPQILWYLLQNGTAMEYFEKIEQHPIPRQASTADFLLRLQHLPEQSILIYYALDLEDESTEVILRTLSTSRELLLATRHYYIFSYRKPIVQEWMI